jgi:23S rRNA G2445 N2-methylase RlmL
MTTRRADDFDLRKAVLDPGFTPRARDADAILDLLALGGDLAGPAERALVRIGAPASAAVVARAEAVGAPGRAAALRLLGRLGAAAPDPAITRALLAALGDADVRVRRAAASAAGRARPEGAEAALAGALAREASASVRRALVEALGKVGGEDARAALAGEAARSDALAERGRARAALMVERTIARRTPSAIDARVAAAAPVRLALRCRGGLEPILEGELPASLGARLLADAPAGVRFEGTLRGPIADLFAARTWISLGFPLASAPVRGDDVGAAVVGALVSRDAQAILRRWTSGPLRYRIAFHAGGKRRALVWRIAEEVERRVSDLVNDPTDSPWEAVVYEAPRLVRVELWPRLDDPRFAYRTGDVPAASHPTIAAALARVAGARDDDVVWDPFVGSGLELCERAILGPYRRLVGSDVDEAALDVARANLAAAGARDATLLRGDAATLVPPGPRPTLIVTNPPLGRRVQRSAALAPLLDRFVAHAARLLAPGGRMVWISPFPERTRAVAEAQGLRVARARMVDMGGFSAELQELAAGERRLL